MKNDEGNLAVAQNEPRPEQKHTPGPWQVERSEIDCFNGEHYTRPADYLSVYMGGEAPDANWADVQGPNQEANALLTAAAPDLLHALMCLTKAIHDDFVPTEYVQQADEAIARATGAEHSAGTPLSIEDK